MAAELSCRWWRRRSLRARLTLITVLALTIALGGGAILVLSWSKQTMTAGVEQTVRRRATMIAARIGQLPQVPDVLTTPTGPAVGQSVQVVDATGNQRPLSPGAPVEPMLDSRQIEQVRAGKVVDVHLPDRGPVLVAGAPVGGPEGPVTVLVAAPIGDVIRSTQVMQMSALVVVPALIGLLGVTVWVVVGSALRPVAVLRREAEEIAGEARARRLPVPATRDEIHDLAVTLNDMLDRLAAAGARQRSFTADAAHELRSPLANLRAQLEVALAYPTGQDWPDLAHTVLGEVRRLSRLSEDLLALARLDGSASAGRAPAGRERAGPADLVAVARTVAERYASARVPVTVQAPCAVSAAAPAGDLDRVLGNLVDNAVRHAATRVDVTVSVTFAEATFTEAVVTVTDDGPGIAPADRQRVFERFTRLDDARDRDAGGSGLGLAIVAETVKSHHGHVTLDDAGPGLRATVTLPSSPSPSSPLPLPLPLPLPPSSPPPLPRTEAAGTA